MRIESCWSASNAYNSAHQMGAGMPTIETSTRKIVARLEREGWVNVGGGSHDKFKHPKRPDVVIVVPRHRTLSPGVARSIAKLAGWL
jgi:predicted RNA binding protein YcfA (HicA-like mRNA interferase family)